MKKLTILGAIHPDAMALAESRDDVSITLVHPNFTPRETLEWTTRGAHGIAVRGARLDADLLAGIPELEIVSRHGVGCDTVAVDWMSANGKPVAIAVGGNDRAVAEHTLGMILTLSRDLIPQNEAMRQADWTVRERVAPSDIEGKTVLIVGYGRIGKRVAPLAQAFGLRMLAYDPYVDHYADGVERVTDLNAALPDVDIVTVHTPLNNETRGIIGPTQLTTMPEGAILINNARGGICDEEAVAAALKSGHLGKYGTDVFGVEPATTDNPIISAPNTLMTPHSASMTPQAMRSMGLIMIQNIFDQFDGCLKPEMVFNRKELGL